MAKEGIPQAVKLIAPATGWQLQDEAGSVIVNGTADECFGFVIDNEMVSDQVEFVFPEAIKSHFGEI